MRILLAEDEPAMAEAIVAFLRYHQFTVDWVDNGTDAYHQACAQAYDGLVLDIMMPGGMNPPSGFSPEDWDQNASAASMPWTEFAIYAALLLLMLAAIARIPGKNR